MRNTKCMLYTHVICICNYYCYCITAGIGQSVQRLATGWTVRGSNPGGDEVFRTRLVRPLGLPRLLYNGYRVLPGGKAVGACRWPSTTSSAEAKERAELYLYSPYRPSCPVLGWTLHLPLPCMICQYIRTSRQLSWHASAHEKKNRMEAPVVR